MNDIRVHAVMVARSISNYFSDDESESDISYLKETIEHIASFVPLQRRWILTSVEQEAFILESVGHLIAGTIVEPETTGPTNALLLASLLIHQQDPDAVLFVLPSYHYIPQKNTFLEFVQHAVDYATQHSSLTILGLSPTHPAPAYYIDYRLEGKLPGKVNFFNYAHNSESAQTYYEQGNLWYTGIIVCGVQTLINHYHSYAPEVYDAIYEYIQGCGDYPQAEKVCFETDFLEKIPEKTVFPIHFAWHSLDDIDDMLKTKSSQNRKNNLIQIDAYENVVESEGSLVALVGVSHLCVIKKGDIILVSHRDHLEKVKKLIDTLKNESQEEAF